MDAVKILGGLLGDGSVTSGSGSRILEELLGGLAGGMAGAQRSGASAGRGARSSGPAGADVLGRLVQDALTDFTATPGSGSPKARKPARPEPRSFDPQPRPAPRAREQDNEEAATLIRAMIYAAKADGRVDRTEQEKIVERLGEVSREEAQFVRHEFQRNITPQEFARGVPRGLEQQVYAMSVLAIDLDSNPEAQYLHQLAQALDISPKACNQIHQQLGAPALYS